MKRIFFGLLTLILALGYTSCVSKMESPELVSKVALSQTTASMVVNTTLQLTATVLPATAINKNVTWQSSNTAVATVSANGLVSAKTTGTATITVTTEDGNKTATCAITVTATAVSVTGITLDLTKISMAVGSTKKLTATVTPATATNKSVTWSTSNSAVATVNSSGTVTTVTAVAAGTATITVKTVDGSKTATCTVTVTKLTEEIHNILPGDLLEKVKNLGIEINEGYTPPNIEGTFDVKPLVLVKSNFIDNFSTGTVFGDMRITFSKQDNAKKTVVLDFTQGSQTTSGLGSFITGNGNKFTVFAETTTIKADGILKSVQVHSGEITPTGIKNYYFVSITTQETPSSIKNGCGRLFYDSDGFSERVTPTKATSNENGISIYIHSKAIF